MSGVLDCISQDVFHDRPQKGNIGVGFHVLLNLEFDFSGSGFGRDDLGKGLFCHHGHIDFP